jgi:formylglycine-generating enzyme required for sulfatase activity
MRYVDPIHPHGIGAVSYLFRIGKTEVTNSQYVAFLNAVAAADTYGLYYPSMATNPRGGIIRTGSPGGYSYDVKPPAIVPTVFIEPFAGSTYTYDDKPVVFVNWADAARFANWLHNGQPTGPQDANTTEDGAYTLNGAVRTSALMDIKRNPGARWWLPSEDEWYKAAYHNNDGVTGNYRDYPTGSNGTPNNNRPSGDTGNSANFNRSPAASFPMTDAGAYSTSQSPYGTFDQGGNVYEWNETILPTQPDTSSFPGRGIRGSSWYLDPDDAMHASRWYSAIPVSLEGEIDIGSDRIGFRAATVPEPGCVGLAILVVVALLWYRRGNRCPLRFFPSMLVESALLTSQHRPQVN